MSKKNNNYTVFILPDPTSKPYSFSIGKKTLRFLVSIAFIALLSVSVVFIQSLSVMEDIGELRALRNANKAQHAQIKAVSESVNDLKKQMARLMELDEKLRVMTDLTPRKGRANILAQGGTEEPIYAAEGEAGFLSGQVITIPIPKIVTALQEDIDNLEQQIRDEEKSFKELIQAISDIQLRWEATPSLWPVKGWVTSSFGPRTSPFTGRLAMHNGLDIAAQRGTRVIAPAMGVVMRVGYDNELGRRVFIDHGFGKKTIYGHLNSQNVRMGQTVKRGDTIGYVGNTGKATGPHLHYEVRINNISVDPMRYILN